MTPGQAAYEKFCEGMAGCDKMLWDQLSRISRDFWEGVATAARTGSEVDGVLRDLWSHIVKEALPMPPSLIDRVTKCLGGKVVELQPDGSVQHKPEN